MKTDPLVAIVSFYGIVLLVTIIVLVWIATP